MHIGREVGHFARDSWRSRRLALPCRRRRSPCRRCQTHGRSQRSPLAARRDRCLLYCLRRDARKGCFIAFAEVGRGRRDARLPLAPRKDLMSTEKRGICYLSRVPPHMDPANLRQILSKYGDIQRLYLALEDPTAIVKRMQARGFRGKQFSEGWVEFTDKHVAKRVVRLLNGEQIGGRRRSSFYYDIWNIKYLSKFKWDDLTNEMANKNRTREQKLAMEISAAKRERDFYMSKVDQSRAMNSMKERIKKKQKRVETVSTSRDAGNVLLQSQAIRQFPQNKPLSDDGSVRRKSLLSIDVLAGVFTGGT